MNTQDQSYDEHYYFGTIRMNRFSIIGAFVFTAVFSPFDELGFGEEAGAFVHTSRLLIFLPLLLLTYSKASLQHYNPSLYNWALMVAACAITVFTVGAFFSTIAHPLLMFAIYMQCLGLFLLAMSLPLLHSLILGVGTFSAGLLWILYRPDTSAVIQSTFASGLFGITTILLMWVYTREKELRRLYKTNLAYSKTLELRTAWSNEYQLNARDEIIWRLDNTRRALNTLGITSPDDVYLTRANIALSKLRELSEKLLASMNWSALLSNNREESIDLSKELKLLAHDFELNYPNVKFNTSFAANQHLYGSNALIIRAVSNIIENAIRYHLNGSSIEVTLNANGALSITNEGPALQAKLSELVRYGYQGSESNRGAHGIGLFVCSTICDSHGILLSVNETPGKVRFTMQFPEKTNPLHAPQQKPLQVELPQ